MTVKCDHCREDVEVNFYFCNYYIAKQESFLLEWPTETYKAIAGGKALCPCCGKEIVKIYHRELTKQDIINFAICGKETNQ